MNGTSTSRSGDLGRVGLAAGASVVASAAWYTAWGDRLARLDEAYAGDARPPAWMLPVELARSAAVATAVAGLAAPGSRAGAARSGSPRASGAPSPWSC